MQGTIALVGSGEYLPPMEPVDRWLLQCVPGTPHVVCLPTAAGPEGPARINYWMDLGVQHFQRLGAEAEGVPVTDRASADAPDCAERIRRANFVYLSGGKPNYLYNTLAGTAVWAAILEVLNRRSITASNTSPAGRRSGQPCIYRSSAEVASPFGNPPDRCATARGRSCCGANGCTAFGALASRVIRPHP